MDLGLDPPGLEDEDPHVGLSCAMAGKGFGTIIAIGKAVSLAQVEASRPGQRIDIGGRTASLAKSQTKDQFAGLCDIAIDVNGSAHARILLSRYDKNTDAARVNAAAVASLVVQRLPNGVISALLDMLLS